MPVLKHLFPLFARYMQICANMFKPVMKAKKKLYDQEKNDFNASSGSFVPNLTPIKSRVKSSNITVADRIRDELLSKGIKLIDTREGTTYELL